MAKVLITESTLEDIADAIRVKANTNKIYKPSEMAAAINNLENDEHRPAHINIAQTDNQTITVNANLFSTSEVQTEHTTNFTVNVPNSVQLNASVMPDTGYTAGELNITSTTVSWGNTVTFSASQATVSQQPNILMTLNEDIDTSGTISYSVLVENTGDVDLTDVEIACEETGDQWTISSLPINDNRTFDLADSDSNTIVVTATSGSYSTSQTFYVAIPVDVTISTGRASKEYDSTSLTSSEYSVDWPGDTTDTITVTVTGSQKEIGYSDNTFTYAIEYNDNPRKYNYNIIPNCGRLTVIAPHSGPLGPSGPTP